MLKEAPPHHGLSETGITKNGRSAVAPVSLISSSMSALEDDSFPFEALSDIAEAESWRKEINRPIYHIHKWWAQRLGTVFRAIVIGAFAPRGSDVLSLFYSSTSIPNVTVFDPFMGSGTTIGEALKLGARAIGRDINPVAKFLVKNALTKHDRSEVLQTYKEIEADTAGKLREYYQTTLPDGEEAEVLYYFWVKQLDCPECSESVDLFSSRVFAQHAYRKKHPKAQATCSHCGEVNEIRYDDTEVSCIACDQIFDPQVGAAKGQYASCQCCAHKFSISKTIRAQNHPPRHRLYAKLVLRQDGTKAYFTATDADIELYDRASRELENGGYTYPIVSIEPGYNTNQALGYNYRSWHEMFNARQLLGLSILSHRIGQIETPALRDLFMCLFSGALEFNNLFASYKGEGTGAVRHMFAHHVLKPERVPLEANIWGTPKSSGSFSTMFAGRIRRALDYAEDPFELVVKKGRSNEKIYGLSEKLGFDISQSHAEFSQGGRVYLSCGDSGDTDLPPCSVDAIISDPPFFDNVNYSELADFFHVWQRHVLGEGRATSTRSCDEVQHNEVNVFTDRLAAVWSESHRVLKDEGVLAFTYHHSRSEGWSSVLSALMKSGFRISATQPIKAEMSVAMPKHQAKEPIDLDIIIVCRKVLMKSPCQADDNSLLSAIPKAEMQVSRLSKAGRKLSRNDIRIVLMAQLIRLASNAPTEAIALEQLNTHQSDIEQQIEALHAMSQAVLASVKRAEFE